MIRIGQGYDVHRLVEGRKLILGGKEIEYELGLLAHSDADVLTHAICDALLGAAALGDIGKLFLFYYEKYKNINSQILLTEVGKRIASAGYIINNVDATVVAQAPKLAQHISDMRENIARSLNIEPQQVSIKATTEEGLGFTGKKEGIAAMAVALIVKYEVF